MKGICLFVEVWANVTLIAYSATLIADVQKSLIQKNPLYKSSQLNNSWKFIINNSFYFYNICNLATYFLIWYFYVIIISPCIFKKEIKLVFSFLVFILFPTTYWSRPVSYLFKFGPESSMGEPVNILRKHSNTSNNC